MTVRKLRRSVFAAFAMFLVAITSVRAQSGLGSIQGVVTDATGSVVVGADVTLVNADSGDRRVVKTSSSGRYEFPTVAPGRYSVEIHAPSFASQVVKDLLIELDKHLDENVNLQAGSETQTVNVEGTVPAVDTTAYNVGGVITQSQIDTLPIQNRQYLNLAVLVPGTNQDSSRSFYNNVEVGGGTGAFYATGFYLDGVTNQQTEEGDPRQNIPEGAVAEFKVYNASFPAELGWAMGGFVTVVTKSGTNKLHGEAFEYFRNTVLTADNQFQQATELAQGTGSPPYNRNQYGFDVGGPIFKNRTHYYGAFERTQQSSSYTLYSTASTFYQPLLGTFSVPGHDQLLTLRLDHDLTDKQQLFARYAQEWNLVSGNGCGGASTLNCYDGSIPRHAIVVGHTWEPKSFLVNEARFQYAYISYELGPYGTPPPSKPQDFLNPSYAQNIGIGYSFPSFSYGKTYAADGVETRWEVNDSATIQRGAHSIKIGADASYVPYTDAVASNLNGTFTFSTDQAFNPANTSNLTAPRSFTQSAVPRLYYLPSTQTAYFAQDSWKAAPNLTFSFGIRYERQYGSAFLDTYTPNPAKPIIPYEGNPHTRGDRNNVSPRIGLSADPFGNGHDVLRAGYGVYYNFIETELTEAEKLNFVACSISLVSGSPPGYQVPFPNPYNGQTVTSYCSTAPPNVTIVSPNMSNPYQHQFSLGYSHQIQSELSVSVDGVYTRGLRDYKTYDRNLPVNYPANTTRPDTQLGQVTQIAPEGATEYKGIYIKLDKRFSHRYMYTASYTLSSALDNGPHASPINYNNLQLDWGQSSVDRRHALVASGSVLLPGKIMLGAIFSFRSSEPYSVTTSVFGGTLLPIDTNPNGTAQYVPGTGKGQGNRGISFAAINAYRADLNAHVSTYIKTPLSTNLGPGSVISSQYKDLDLRVSKFIFQRDTKKLEIIGQAFNILGNENYGGISTSATSTSFGQPTSAGTVQIGELAARFTF